MIRPDGLDEALAAIREQVPAQIDHARRTLAETGDRDDAMKQLAIRFGPLSHGTVAALAADALLRLAEREG